jgi:hypothetical protein
MLEDPIVAKIRKVRDAYAAQFNCDLNAIYRDLRRQEKESGLTFVSYPPKRPEPGPGTGERPEQSGD